MNAELGLRSIVRRKKPGYRHGTAHKVYECITISSAGLYRGQSQSEVVLYGKSRTGKQRLLCRNPACHHKIFHLEYANNACRPGTKEKIVEMAMNGAGVRDTGRVLDISPNTVTAVLKKMGKFAKPVGVPKRAGRKERERRKTGCGGQQTITLAYTFGTQEHKYLDELPALLKLCLIGKAYEKRISAERLVTSKKNTQRIERDHLTLRTRLKRLCRKTICFSKSKEIHIVVVGTFINCFFWGRTFDVSTLV